MKTHLIFLLPLGLSVFATAYFWLATDLDKKWKSLALALTVTALLLQFVPALRFRFHLLYPLFLQVAVSFWFIIYTKLEGTS